MQRFRCSKEEIMERQVLIRRRAFATFSTIGKALADRMRPACFAGLPSAEVLHMKTFYKSVSHETPVHGCITLFNDLS